MDVQDAPSITITTTASSNSQSEHDIFDTRIHFEEIPISALRQKSRNILSMHLDPHKILPTHIGLCRDWRGLFQLTGLPKQYLQYLATKSNITAELLDVWYKEECDGQLDYEGAPTVQQLQQYLEEIDRWDCLDDTRDLFVDDAKEYLKSKAKRNRVVVSQTGESVKRNIINVADEQTILTIDDLRLVQEGRPLQQYDAFVTFADEDIDFATELINEMESRGLKLCVKERDLLSHSFEHHAIRRLLTERCNRLIVILSPAFVLSPLNEFIANVAQSLSIKHGTRKLIPCVYESCDIPELFHHMHLLSYKRRLLFDYWEKLYSSVILTPDERSVDERISVPSITISDADAPPPVASVQPQPPPTISNTMLTTPRLRNISKIHSSSASNLVTTSSPSTDDEFVKPRKIYPPEQRRRSSTSMLNLHLANSLTGEPNNNTINGGSALSPDGELRAPKKRKWYKKLLISPQHSFKLTSSDTDISGKHKDKDKKKLWFRKKLSSH